MGVLIVLVVLAILAFLLYRMSSAAKTGSGQQEPQQVELRPETAHNGHDPGQRAKTGYGGQHVDDPDDPTAAIRAADADITTFGEELRNLDLEVVGHNLDTAAQQDYQRALDAYENAKESIAQVSSTADIVHVTSILEDGRYAISCVKARIAGDPLPVKRPPCFFNPAHGPSSQNVQWAPEGGSMRDVPACAADAERVLAGAEPCIRTVASGPARVPYWEDPAHASYAKGYYSSWQDNPVVKGMAIGAAAFIGLAVLPDVIDAATEAFDDVFGDDDDDDDDGNENDEEYDSDDDYDF